MAEAVYTHVSRPSGDRRSRLDGLRSLHFKASLLIVVLILLVSVAGMCMSLQTTRAALLESDAQRTASWAASLSSSVAEDLASGDREALLKAANSSVQLHKAAYVVFADAHGRVLASAEARAGLVDQVTRRSGEEHKLDMQLMRQVRLRQHGLTGMTYIETAVPVLLPRRETAAASPPVRVAGYLRCATDISDTRIRLMRTARELVRIAIVIMLLVVPCSLLATRRVVAPLNALARVAHALAKGSMDARANIQSKDEIGALASAFNFMADRVTAAQCELLEVNAELERRVIQRTRDLEEQAARDPLTGLYNRRHFGEVMTREFAAAERYQHDLTCLMFDLDHFKEINDRHGHRMGDKVLMALARALAGELRASDVAARFGGDEFILLLPQTSAQQASTSADRVVERFNRITAEVVPDINATVSIGVASLHTTRARSAEALIHEADVALYAAKEGGRNQTMQAAWVETGDA